MIQCKRLFINFLNNDKTFKIIRRGRLICFDDEKDKRRDGEELPILFVRNRVMNDGAMAPPTRNDDKKRKRSGGVCGPALVKSVCLSLEVARVRQFSWRDLTASPTNALSNVQYERIIPNGHIKKIRKKKRVV